MIEIYRRYLVERGYAEGICAYTPHCGYRAFGPVADVRDRLSEHGARHRPGGMVLTDYGARVGVVEIDPLPGALVFVEVTDSPLLR